VIQIVPLEKLPPRRHHRGLSTLSPLVEQVLAVPAGHAILFPELPPARAARLGERLKYMLRDRGFRALARSGDGGLYVWVSGRCELSPSRRRKSTPQ
jgi:hypothetical protein